MEGVAVEAVAEGEDWSIMARVRRTLADISHVLGFTTHLVLVLHLIAVIVLVGHFRLRLNEARAVQMQLKGVEVCNVV